MRERGVCVCVLAYIRACGANLAAGSELYACLRLHCTHTRTPPHTIDVASQSTAGRTRCALVLGEWRWVVVADGQTSACGSGR